VLSTSGSGALAATPRSVALVICTFVASIVPGLRRLNFTVTVVPLRVSVTFSTMRAETVTATVPVAEVP
jgi:hypothetical protein